MGSFPETYNASFLPTVMLVATRSLLLHKKWQHITNDYLLQKLISSPLLKYTRQNKGECHLLEPRPVSRAEFVV